MYSQRFVVSNSRVLEFKLRAYNTTDVYLWFFFPDSIFYRDLRFTDCARVDSQGSLTKKLSLSASPLLRFERMLSNLILGSGELFSGPHAYVANTLPTNPSLSTSLKKLSKQTKKPRQKSKPLRNKCHPYSKAIKMQKKKKCIRLKSGTQEEGSVTKWEMKRSHL